MGDVWDGVWDGVSGFVLDGVKYAVIGGKTVINGAEFIVRNGKLVLEVAEDHVLSAAETAAKAAADSAITALEATDRYLKTTLCSATGAGVTTIAAGTAGHFAGKTATIARIAATVSLATPPGIGTAIGIGIGIAIVAYCTDGFTSNPYNDSAPEPASGLSASAGAGRIVVAWSASATVPAAGFGYRVQWLSGSQTWAESEAADQFEDLKHGSDLATSYTITGLSGGSAYDVRVAAFNADGFSDWVSGQATPTAPAVSAPDPASALSVVAGDKQIAVSWSASPTTEGLLGYRVQWKTGAQTWDQAVSANQFHSVTGTRHEITGLVNGSAYDVRVAAFNKQGLSTWIDATATPTAPASAPDPASGLSVTAGDKQIAVSWSASATTPAAGFGYRVQWKLVTQAWGDAAVGSEDLDHGSDLATSHTITGLVNGSAYDVRVAAFNANGVSTWITGQTTPTAPKPEAKPSLAFDSVSCESSGSGWVISVTWSKTPETLKPDIWASEAKNRGHRGRQTAVAGTSTTFDVPNAGWYQVGMQAKIAGNKKVGDSEPVRCR